MPFELFEEAEAVLVAEVRKSSKDKPVLELLSRPITEDTELLKLGVGLQPAQHFPQAVKDKSLVVILVFGDEHERDTNLPVQILVLSQIIVVFNLPLAVVEAGLEILGGERQDHWQDGGRSSVKKLLHSLPQGTICPVHGKVEHCCSGPFFYDASRKGREKEEERERDGVRGSKVEHKKQNVAFTRTY